MSQSSIILPNVAGAAIRTFIDNALIAIVTKFSGVSEPSTTYSNMSWIDTNNANPIFKFRNNSNNSWINMGIFEGNRFIQANKNFLITVDDDFSPDNEDVVLVDCSLGIRTITLPSVSSSLDKVIDIKKIDSGSNKVTVQGLLSENIDGSLTYDLINQYDYVRLICDGVQWFIIGNGI